MDWACKILVGILERERMSFSQLVEKSGLSRQTVHNHLKHLLVANVVSQEAVKHGRGRPAVFYHKSKLPIKSLDDSDIVRLTFQKLKHSCRFEKGGWCKEAKNKCAQEKCRLTIKTK